jgi:hypothetical protein
VSKFSVRSVFMSENEYVMLSHVNREKKSCRETMYYGTKISDFPNLRFSFSNGREDLTLKLHISNAHMVDLLQKNFQKFFKIFFLQKSFLKKKIQNFFENFPKNFQQISPQIFFRNFRKFSKLIFSMKKIFFFKIIFLDIFHVLVDESCQSLFQSHHFS